MIPIFILTPNKNRYYTINVHKVKWKDIGKFESGRLELDDPSRSNFQRVLDKGESWNQHPNANISIDEDGKINITQYDGSKPSVKSTISNKL